jgi:MotA/TolQ/ExbB proton channel family
VFGLLGTVAGVAVAVGGFAEFLGGDIEDVAVIKKSLVNVTAGLSYAFLTTLYGLGTALVLMLLTSGLQTREEKLLARIHQSVANVFLPLIESVAPQRTAPGELMLPGLQEQLTNVTAAVMEYVREQAHESLKSFKEERELLREDILRWGDLLKQKASDGAHDIGQAIDRVGMKLANAQLDFLQKFESIKSEMDKQAAAVLRSTVDLTNTVSARQEAMLQGIAEQNVMLDKNASTMSELNNLTRDATRVSENINGYLDKLLALGLDRRANDIVHVIESQRIEMETSQSALTANAELTREVLVAQKVLTDSMNKLYEVKLDYTLKQLGDSLVDLKPVLENLREPFILQAVPVAKEHLPQAKSPA